MHMYRVLLFGYMAKWHKMYRDGVNDIPIFFWLAFVGSIPTCACFHLQKFGDLFLKLS